MRSSRRRRPWPAALLLAVLPVAAWNADPQQEAAPPSHREPATEQPTPTIAAADPLRVFPPVRHGGERSEAASAATAVAAPQRLRMPGAGVDTPLERIGLLPDGAMAVPEDPQRAGWYTPGPRPGERGPAVIAGHVDSWQGPGVFARLADAARGDEILVELADGSVLRFQVTVVERHPKDALPVERIWGATERPALRLITCGGDFDRARRSYNGNVVVFAELADR